MSMARMVLVLACLAVSACGAAKKPEDAGNATGKVLAGSISDAMINLDQSHAEAPLAGLGSGVPVGENEAARNLLAPAGADVAADAGAAGSDAPAVPQDRPTKAAPAAIAPKPAEKVAEPAANPAKPLAKPTASTPAKARPKPAFSKPSDDGGA
ncbi:hypothetical protein [Novosphingobium sp.]|uniref:hypothetical protein n=1 Tax=Novosphingobium sp. TaxID=1874826 RepID=UPI0025FBF8CF|nr:hypothetical protein [Novosphingobium sp.]